MKIIYSGGYNNLINESIKESFIFKFESTIKKAVKSGKKICFVTLAMNDGYYDNLLITLYEKKVDIINHKEIEKVRWEIYDGIFILGGKISLLHQSLIDAKFSLNALKNEVVILGDSAGSYMLSSYLFDSPPGAKRGIKIKYLTGFNPQSNIITISHTNNVQFCNEALIKNVELFAKEKKLKVLLLKENEQIAWENNDFIELKMDSLFL